MLIGIAVATALLYPRISRRLRQTPFNTVSPTTLARAIWRVLHRRLS